VFHGANISENIELSANGNRLRFTRNVANIVLDVDGVEQVNFHALGGADNMVVNSLAGTAVTQVNVDLAGVLGGTNGDGQIDVVSLNGTAGSDTFNIAANGAAVEATGLGALVRVLNAEATNDVISINGVGGDHVNVNGSALADVMTVIAVSTNIAQVNVSGFTLPVNVSGALTLSVNGLGGPDTISCSGNLAGVGIPLTLDGGDGNDTISGSNGSDIILGGAGNDILDGNQGNDFILGGADDDTFVWDPGDGSDVIEGQGGNDTLVFHGSNINENIDISANGSRLRFTRNVANIVLDVDGVEVVNFYASGGADNVVVNNLTGTAVTQVNIDLAATGGGGDAAVDVVSLNGTAGSDTFNIAANGAAVEATGLGALVRVLNAESTNDVISINGVGGDHVNVNGSALADVMTVTAVSTNIAQVNVSGFTLPVNVSGALTLSVNGLGGPDTISCVGNLAGVGIPLTLDGGDGNDTISGSNGSDIILGGAGNDILDGNQGNDFILGGADDDTFVWDPGDGSDVIEGQGGNDTLVFHGSNIAESIDISANGNRLRFFRNVANVNLDVNGVEQINFHALGGADMVVVNSLAGTAVTQVNIDLAGVLGGSTGDAAIDMITVNGTAVADIINIIANAGAVDVSGLAALVRILHPEVANDSLIVNGLGGTDTFNVGSGVSALIGVTVNQ
jgi:Ca2+-binding RTX toxin-like protein